MRTKIEIMKSFYDPKLDRVSDSGLSVYMIGLILEVFIDTRDILDNRLLEIDRDIDKILTALKDVK